MASFQANLARLRRIAPRDMEVVLWTDVPRERFEEANLARGRGDAEAGGVPQMLDFAVKAGVVLVNIHEVFSVGEPMRLRAMFEQEMAGQSPEGATQASDIARFEILLRLGGAYSDPDNPLLISDGAALDEHLTDLFRAKALAAHRVLDAGSLNNSAFLAARNHPFNLAMLDLIERRYGLDQRELYESGYFPLPPLPSRLPGDELVENLGKWANNGTKVFRRRSVLLRTDPEALMALRLEQDVPLLNEVFRATS